MKEIVGARIGSIITADVGVIHRAFEAGKVTDFLDRETMRFMSNLDLGKHWDAMANAPTLFCIGDNGKPCAAKGSGEE